VKKTPESQVLRSILDYLAARHILAFRMNTGAIKLEKRFVRFGAPGMADILAFPVWHDCGKARMGSVLWIEVKAEKGTQSAFQLSFQTQVEAAGHVYILARSIEDVEAAGL
jgi:hypothetical protein